MKYNLELEKAADAIKKEKAKRVCIQLPDGLKPKADEIASYLEKNTNAEIIVWLGSCFGACDTPSGLENINIDLVLQWGHNEFQWKRQRK